MHRISEKVAFFYRPSNAHRRPTGWWFMQKQIIQRDNCMRQKFIWYLHYPKPCYILIVLTLLKPKKHQQEAITAESEPLPNQFQKQQKPTGEDLVGLTESKRPNSSLWGQVTYRETLAIPGRCIRGGDQFEVEDGGEERGGVVVVVRRPWGYSEPPTGSCAWGGSAGAGGGWCAGQWNPPPMRRT
jgi:hypothetical protein